MQKYSDFVSELKASQELCTQLEVRCTETLTELERTRTTVEENQQEFDVTFIYVFACL